MTYSDVIILIPSHSLEDFPTEQGDVPAAGLLNAFAVAWHPRFLARMPQLPRWHRADDPPHAQSGQLFLVPDICDGWLPHGWAERAREAGAVVVDHLHLREEMVAAALAPLEPLDVELDADLVADFLALGTCWLQVELLTRHMRNFGNIDEIRLQNRAIAAARAVVAQDRETAEAHLRTSFEILLEARERFYPVDCFLIDLCLVIPEVANEQLRQVLATPGPVNVLLTGRDLQQLADEQPELMELLRAGIAAERVELIGGERDEAAVPVLPAASWLHELQSGQQIFERCVGRSPRVWGRRRFGLSSAWPQILKKSGYVGALHVVLDDGIYPDAEMSRFRWQGCDGEATIEAFSRIPLAADTASTFLRFPVRMAESMDHDHIAAVCFARWPEVRAPWLGDLQRSQKYAPVLGKFITFEHLFAVTGAPGKLSQHPASEYFTPFLLQHAARRDADPLTRYAGHTQRRIAFDAANWCRALSAALRGQPIGSTAEQELELLVEDCGPDRSGTVDLASVEDRLQVALQEWPQQLATTLLGTNGPQRRGVLLLNPYRFPRRMLVDWPAEAPLPAVSGTVKFVDEATTNHGPRVTVDVPGCGFVWLSHEEATQPEVRKVADSARRLPPVADWVMRNDRFEVSFNPATGGILQVRHPLKRENRFSQLVAFRFPRERQLPATEDRPATKSQYAETRCLGQEVLCDSGPVLEVATFGEIVDQLNGACLARFRQRTSLIAYRPEIQIEVELSDVKLPDGDPWNNYFCLRFAWDSSSASITRSLLDGAQPIGGDRFESTEYIEIADETERVTIIPHGLPFHRKTGPRMLDTLLVVTGETSRKFRFTVAVDQPYPLEAARDALGPVLAVPTTQGFAHSGTSGWLLHLDVRNVQILGLLDLQGDSPEQVSSNGKAAGWAIRLLETEGRGRPARLRTWQQPLKARKRDLQGQTVTELAIEGDVVLFEMAPYELAELELYFA